MIGKIEQLRNYHEKHAPFDFEKKDKNIRSKVVVLITNILMEDDNKRELMIEKAEKIVDLIHKCFT